MEPLSGASGSLAPGLESENFYTVPANCLKDFKCLTLEAKVLGTKDRATALSLPWAGRPGLFCCGPAPSGSRAGQPVTAGSRQRLCRWLRPRGRGGCTPL